VADEEESVMAESEIVNLSENEDSGFAYWCIVELMGHRRLAGWVTEQNVFGTTMMRVDIPSDPVVTQLYSQTAIYAVTPTTEQCAREVASRFHPEPVSPWELRPISDGSPF
jgi:hypothetical protein